MDLIDVGLDDDIRRGLKHLESSRLIDGPDLAAGKFIEGLHGWRSLGHHKLLEGGVIRITEKNLLPLVSGDLDTADHAIVETAPKSRNKTIPAVLDELGLTPHMAGNSTDDLVLKSSQPVVPVIEGKRGITGNLGGPA
jgi:hypothetical protein